MIGIDTNILVRVFQAEDDPKQSGAAKQLVRDQSPVFLSLVVLAEFAWTLRTIFKIDRKGIVLRLTSIVDAAEFTTAFPEAVGRAVERYAEGPADFADYLIGELNLAYGCDVTFTFDEDATKRNRAVRILEV